MYVAFFLHGRQRRKDGNEEGEGGKKVTAHRHIHIHIYKLSGASKLTLYEKNLYCYVRDLSLSSLPMISIYLVMYTQTWVHVYITFTTHSHARLASHL